MPHPPSSSGKIITFPQRSVKRRSTTRATQSLALTVTPSASRARLGMTLVIGSETMLFAGLVAMYLSLRLSTLTWPSAHHYLPITMTWINTGFLFLSCYTMHRALTAGRIGDQRQLLTFLSLTGGLGSLFLCIQGYEWIQILREGIMTHARIYGSTFYLLIGCHALHVLGAVIWLLIVLTWAQKEQLAQTQFVRAELCGMYWYFVGAVWAVLFPLIYLT
ncbi:MAG: heme-copper oxidase subunit III [Candidatus Binatia bacterium]